MESRNRRTIRKVTWVIETEGLTKQEHDRRVAWVEKNLLNSSQDIVGAFVYAVIYDEDETVVRFVGYGDGASPETKDIIKDLLSESA